MKLYPVWSKRYQHWVILKSEDGPNRVVARLYDITEETARSVTPENLDMMKELFEL